MADDRMGRVVERLAGTLSSGFADAFVERSTLEVRGRHVGRDVERAHVPLSRDERGVALRLVASGRCDGVHAAGDADERVEALARALREGSVPRVPPIAGAGAAPGTFAWTSVLEALVSAARAALLRESAVEGIDVDVHDMTRDVGITSSLWPFASDARRRAVASVTVRASAGERTVHVTRNRGDVSLDALDARALVAEAIEAALARRDARDAPPGRPTVIVAGGAAGVLLHEAVGHALEADVVARGASFLGSRIGELVATEALTVVDDPTLPGLAGTHARDDEGAPARPAILVERGVLRGVMTDASRAGAGADSTGHGRRASFRDHVLPRMTNTLVHAGPWDPAELLATTADGLLVTRLERASADPLRGRFQVRAIEGWRIEDGRLTHPIGETLLVGLSDELLRGLELGNDVAWDDGAGSCGREAQFVPVAVGNPTLRVVAGAFGVA